MRPSCQSSTSIENLMNSRQLFWIGTIGDNILKCCEWGLSQTKNYSWEKNSIMYSNLNLKTFQNIYKNLSNVFFLPFIYYFSYFFPHQSGVSQNLLQTIVLRMRNFLFFLPSLMKHSVGKAIFIGLSFYLVFLHLKMSKYIFCV